MDDRISSGSSAASAEPGLVSNGKVLRALQDRKRRAERSLLVLRKERRAPSAAPLAPTPQADAVTSKQSNDDPGQVGAAWGASLRILTPQLDLASLYDQADVSSELGQNIDAMTTNIAGHGGTLKCRHDLKRKDLPLGMRKEIMAEFVRFTNLLNTGVLGAVTGGPSVRMTFRELRRRRAESKWKCGSALWEILPNRLGQRCGLRYLPAVQVWATERDPTPTLASVPSLVAQLADDGVTVEWKLEEQENEIHFRRYVQRTPRGDVWFKELGDPRTISARTGKEISAANANLEDPEANEVYHCVIPSDTSVMGRVPWVGNLITTYGDRAAEEINFDTLENDAIPAMLAVVNGSNVKMADATLEAFEELENRPNRNRMRWLTIMTESVDQERDSVNPHVDVKPLIEAQMRDSMFQQYQKNNADKTRSSFRHSEIFVGRNTTAGKSAIDPARKLADEQVYKPQRDAEDDQDNNVLWPYFGFRFWFWESRGPDVTDDQDKIKLLSAGEHVGAITPKIAREVLSDILNKDLGEVEWGDPNKPHSMQVAEIVSPLRKTEVRVGPTNSPSLVRVDKDIGADNHEMQDAVREIVRQEVREELSAVRELLEELRRR